MAPFDPFAGTPLKIYTYPDPILKKVAEPVSQFDSQLKALVQNMFTTMYQAPGIGLAAPQVGVSQRLFVFDIDYCREEIPEDPGKYSYKNFNPQVIINPIFKEKTGETLFQEGCLSVPGVYEEVTRYEFVTLEYHDVEGQSHTLKAEGLKSICLQHETDHLDGIVFLERLSTEKRDFLAKKFQEISKTSK